MDSLKLCSVHIHVASCAWSRRVQPCMQHAIPQGCGFDLVNVCVSDDADPVPDGRITGFALDTELLRGGCARVIERHVTTLTSASYCIENSTEFNFCATFSNLLWNAV